MNLNSKQIGTITEYQCATFFLERGYVVSFPLGEYSPYDFILDYNNKLYKIQVKHSSPTESKTGFIFSCSRTHVNRSRNVWFTYSEDEVDYFCTMFEGQCYLVPSSECKSSKQLRTELTKNYNHVPWAVNYEADYILNKLINPNAKPRVNMDKLLQIQLDSERRERRQNLMKTSTYGKKCITNGIINKYIDETAQPPEGFRFGRTDKKIVEN